MTQDTDRNNFFKNNENNEQHVSNLFSNFLNKSNTTNITNVNKLKPFFSQITKRFNDLLNHYIGRETISEVGDLSNVSNDYIKTNLANNDYIYLSTSDNWGGKVFFVFKEPFVSFIVDAFYGANTPKLTSRRINSLSIGERTTLNEIGSKLIALLNSELAQIKNAKLHYKMSFTADQLFTETSLPSNMYQVEFKVTIGDTTASMYILMPHKSYDMLEELTDQYLNSDTTAIDPIWQNSLYNEIKSTDMPIRAYISLGNVSLDSLTDLKVGQNFPLSFDAFNRINVATPEKLLYIGSLGRVDNNYSVKITQLVGNDD